MDEHEGINLEVLDGFEEYQNTHAGVPPEFAHDPEYYYAIQNSLKVILSFSKEINKL